MILESGDIVLVSHRRMFDGDEARYFIGRTLVCEGHLIKAEGFSFVRDLSNGHIVKNKKSAPKWFRCLPPVKLSTNCPATLTHWRWKSSVETPMHC